MMPDTTFSYASSTPTLQDRLAELFSFEGRIGRQQYWLRALVIGGMNLAMAIPLAIGQNQEGLAAAFWFVMALAIYGVAFWASLATVVKRLHDRGRSGWFMLIGMIPLVGIWVAIEVGFLRGDEGANEYGEAVA